MKLAIVFLSLGILGILHQKFFTGGGWFNFEQFWHHESLIAIALAIGLTALLRRK